MLPRKSLGILFIGQFIAALMDLPIFCSFRFFFFLSDYGYHPNGNDCVRDEHKPPELCIHGDVEKDKLGSVRLVSCDFAV